MNQLIKNLVTGIAFATLSFQSSAQVNYISKEWVSTNGSVGAINRSASVLDNNDNLIVVSNTLNSNGDTDVHLLKYDEEGTLLWQTTYNGSGNGDDYGVQLIVNSQDEIFVVAALHVGTNDTDIGLLKYTASGTLSWASIWGGSANGYDVPADLIQDGSGNTYVVGGSEASNGQSDYTMIKYNSSGVEQWQTGYDYNNLHDAATSVTISSGSPVITGASASTATNWDYTTLSLNPTTGVITNTNRTSVSGVGLDKALDVATDDNNNVYITGYIESGSVKNIRTLKFDNSFNLAWTANYNGTYDDIGKSIDVDTTGNVYVTGSTKLSSGKTNFFTIKYNSSGVEQWKKEYGNGASSFDTYGAEHVVVDNNERIMVVGTIDDNGDKDFMTICYDLDGDVVFTEEYDNNGFDDEASEIEIDGNDFYITGSSSNGTTRTTMIVKFEIYEKTINYDKDTTANTYYEANDLIIRLDESVILSAAIDDKFLQAGNLSDFLTTSAVSDIELALKSVCDDNAHCPVTVYKIFRNLTTQSTTSTSRFGEEVPVPHIWTNLLFEFPEDVDPIEAAEELQDLYPTVKYAQLNLAAEMNTVVPDDSLYPFDQGSLHETPWGGSNDAHINVEPAWEYTAGESFVKVGVVDGPVKWDHEDFGDGTTTGTKVQGWDFVGNVDLHNYTGSASAVHGTSVASIIGAIRNNEIGIAGIAGGNDTTGNTPENAGASIYGLNVNPIPDSLTPINHAADAYVMGALSTNATDPGYGLHIINNSWGISEDAPASFADTNITILVDALHFVSRNGVTFVASRGNSGQWQLDNGTEHHNYPAIIDDDWVICVGGTGTDGDYHDGAPPLEGVWRASAGWEIDVAAPSSSAIVTAAQVPFDSTIQASSTYNTFSGTSGSAPHVSGTAALMMSYFNHNTDHLDNLAHEDVEFILEFTARDVNSGNPNLVGQDSLIGYGRIDAGKALQQLDTLKYRLIHYDQSVLQTTMTLTQLGADTVTLSEGYENDAHDWFAPNTDYKVNVFKLAAELSYNLNSNEVKIAAWPRPSASHVFEEPDAAGTVIPRERVFLEDLSPSTVHRVSGYVYEVFDMQNNALGWWPRNYTDPDFNMGYSLLVSDTTINLEMKEQISQNHKMTIYPNPTNGIQYINVIADQPLNGQIRLLDINGRLVKDIYTGIFNEGENYFSIDLSNLAKGLYVYVLTDNDGNYEYRKSIIE